MIPWKNHIWDLGCDRVHPVRVHESTSDVTSLSGAFQLTSSAKDPNLIRTERSCRRHMARPDWVFHLLEEASRKRLETEPEEY